MKGIITVDKGGIVCGPDGALYARCPDGLADDMMAMYGLDVRNDQSFIRRALAAEGGRVPYVGFPESREIRFDVV